MSGPEARERLIEAAGPVFAAKGFTAATVREICDGANVNLASVNYHFGDKESLYIEVVRRAQALREKKIPFPVRDETATAEQRMLDFVQTMMRRMLGADRAPWQVQLMMREVLHPTAACRHLVEEYFRPQFARLMGIVDELSGGLLAEHRIRQLAFSLIGQCLYYRVAGPIAEMLTPADEYAAHFDHDSLARHVSETMIAALTQLKAQQAVLDPTLDRGATGERAEGSQTTRFHSETGVASSSGAVHSASHLHPPADKATKHD